jgi:hypothetical protein
VSRASAAIGERLYVQVLQLPESELVQQPATMRIDEAGSEVIA